MSYQQKSLESAASSCWLSSSGPSWGCQVAPEVELLIWGAYLFIRFYFQYPQQHTMLLYQMLFLEQHFGNLA